MPAVEFKVDIKITEAGKPTRFALMEGGDEQVTSMEELLAFTKKSLIEISSEVLIEEQAIGFDRKPVLIVDNRYNKLKEDVNPLGKIEYASRENIKDIALFIYDAITIRSIQETGTYKKYNVLFVNKVLVASTRAEIESYFNRNPNPKQGDKIRFVNITPYARMLERHSKYSKAPSGKVRFRKSSDKQGRSGIAISGKEGLHVLAENGAYFLAARSAGGKFKGRSYIKYESLPGGYLGVDKLSVRGPKGDLRKTFKKTGTPYLYPTILIYVQASGILGGIEQ